MEVYEMLELLFEKIKKGKIDVIIIDDSFRKVIGIGSSKGILYTDYDVSLTKWERSNGIGVFFNGLSVGKYRINTEEGKKIDEIFNEIWNWKQNRINIKKQKEIEEIKQKLQQYVENCDKDEIKEEDVHIQENTIDKETIEECSIIQKIKRWFGRG